MIPAPHNLQPSQLRQPLQRWVYGDRVWPVCRPRAPRLMLMPFLHAQAQSKHWRMLAEERAATLGTLRAELQHAQVMAHCLVRLCTSYTCLNMAPSSFVSNA